MFLRMFLLGALLLCACNTFRESNNTQTDTVSAEDTSTPADVPLDTATPEDTTSDTEDVAELVPVL